MSDTLVISDSDAMAYHVLKLFGSDHHDPDTPRGKPPAGTHRSPVASGPPRDIKDRRKEPPSQIDPSLIQHFNVVDFERKRRILREKGFTLTKERRKLEELLRRDIEFTLLVEEVRKTLKIRS